MTVDVMSEEEVPEQGDSESNTGACGKPVLLQIGYDYNSSSRYLLFLIGIVIVLYYCLVYASLSLVLVAG